MSLDEQRQVLRVAGVPQRLRNLKTLNPLYTPASFQDPGARPPRPPARWIGDRDSSTSGMGVSRVRDAASEGLRFDKPQLRVFESVGE
jgi:hypothetical protein